MDYLKACIAFFNEKVEVQELERKADYLAVKLSFSKTIFYHKNFFFNRLLSFGFIKSYAC